MAEVKFTDQSIDDLNDIAEYISNDSVFYAELQIQKLINRTDILENFPQIGRIVPELNLKSVRKIIEGNYRIIYRVVNKSMIHILTFHHSRRKMKRTVIKTMFKKSR